MTAGGKASIACRAHMLLLAAIRVSASRGVGRVSTGGERRSVHIRVEVEVQVELLSTRHPKQQRCVLQRVKRGPKSGNYWHCFRTTQPLVSSGGGGAQRDREQRTSLRASGKKEYRCVVQSPPTLLAQGLGPPPPPVLRALACAARALS